MVTKEVAERQEKVSLIVISVYKVSTYTQEAEMVGGLPNMNTYSKLTSSRLNELMDLSPPILALLPDV